MKPNIKFCNLDRSFWATVRTLGQSIGYTERKSGQIKAPSIDEFIEAYKTLDLNVSQLITDQGSITNTGALLVDYFSYRASILDTYVKEHLMDADQASALFDKLYTEYKPNSPIPMNKQTGEKKAPAYFTGLINMLIERESERAVCDYDPRELTTIVKNGIPIRTLSRRVDGAFPSTVNPIAIWEIKEYYYTTTFGSRVADGVYETLLDGMELDELCNNQHIHILHYLMIDSKYTWWVCGRSYLCRIIDMLHMGYVDEVIFGYEVLEAIPRIVKQWIAIKTANSTDWR